MTSLNMNTIVPIYLKNSDLPNQTGKNTRLDICQIVNQHVPDHAIGAQLVLGVWSLWLKNIRARDYMINKVKNIEVYGRSIDIHDIYPTAKSIPNEKIVLKDIPLSVKDSEILEFLNDQPGIMVKSGVIAARIRDSNNKLTPFYSGDRFVYVNGLFSPTLHNIGLIDHNKCRVWHQSHERACLRCRKTDHITTDTEKCGAYTDEGNIISIRSPRNVFSNYYLYPMKVFGHEFLSAEHAYQWRFMMYIGNYGYAQEVLDADTPSKAKEVTSHVPRHLHQDWHNIKLTVMREILHAKADYCQLFRTALLESQGKHLVESTQDMFWVSGLPPNYTATTRQDYYPGSWVMCWSL